MVSSRGLWLKNNEFNLTAIMSSNYTIFKATSDQAESLADLAERTFREAFELMTAARDLAAYIATNFTPQKMRMDLAHLNSAVFIAEINGLWVGYGQLKAGGSPECVTGPSPIQLYRLYVFGEHQGKGLGQALMKTCYRHAVNNGFKTLWLTTWTKNTRTIAIYRRAGFETVGAQVFWVGNDPQKDFIMAKSLPGSERC